MFLEASDFFPQIFSDWLVTEKNGENVVLLEISIFLYWPSTCSYFSN